MANPSPAYVGAGRGEPPVSGSAWGCRFLRSCPQTSTVRAGQAVSHWKAHLALGSPALVGLFHVGGRSWWEPLLSVPCWWQRSPKRSVKDHEPWGWVCRALGSSGLPAERLQCVQEMREDENWIARSSMGQRDGGFGQHDEPWPTHVWVSMYGCTSQLCDKGLQLVFCGGGFLSYQTSMFMVSNLCCCISWESRNRLPCAPQEQYLSSFEQGSQS